MASPNPRTKKGSDAKKAGRQDRTITKKVTTSTMNDGNTGSYLDTEVYYRHSRNGPYTRGR